jgi:hypothetical protein
MIRKRVDRNVVQGRKRLPDQSVREDDTPRHDQDYDVGFGKPPKHSRFKPGASGNPKGRPKWKGRGTLNSLIGTELYRPVRLNQNGERISMPALQVALRRLVRMGAEGNPKAVETMLKIARDHSETIALEEKQEISGLTNEERLERIRQLFARVQRRIETKNRRAEEGQQQKQLNKK